MKQESVSFLSENQMLHGVLSSSEPDTRLSVVVLHPHPLYGGDMNNHVVTTVERFFIESGFTTLRFDFRGTSTSPQGYSGVSGAVNDALNAVEFLKTHTRNTDIGIVGYSFGASTAIRLALLKPPPFLITLSASRDLVSEDGFDIDQLRNITCPVLMFHGRSDQMIPFGDLTALADVIGLDSDYKVSLDGEGHYYQKSLSDVVASIREFVGVLYT